MSAAPLKLLRTLRLDASDTFVFERAAASGEWAVPGGFEFWGAEAATLAGKRRAAFRSGFLGLDSFGFSTLAEIVEVSSADIEAAVTTLAQHLMTHHGAPDLEAARTAAAEEITFAQSLCEHAPGTVIALQRTVEPDGQVRERFRTLKVALGAETNSFGQGCVLPIGIAPDDGASATGEAEEVDLVGLMSSGNLSVSP